MSDGRGRGAGSGRGRGRGGRGRGDGVDLPFRRRGDFPGGGRADGGGRGGGRGGDRGDRGGRGGFGGGRGRDQGPRIFKQGESVPEPALRVEKTENAVAAALAVNHEKTPGQARYPERPGYGTAGKPVTLYANYLPLTTGGKELFRYHVSIAADAAGRRPTGKKARQIVRLLLEEHFPREKNSIATDYLATLISCVELPEAEHYHVRYRDDHEDEYPENPRIYRVSCQYTGQISPADLVNYLTSTRAGDVLESKAEILQALNVIVGHHPKTDRSVVSVGANRHFGLHPGSAERYNLGAGLEVLRGFFVSVRAATARVLLNVQVKYLACYQEGPLGIVIREYQRATSRNAYRLEAFLKRIRVRVTHIVRKNSRGQSKPRVKTIAGLATRADGASSPYPPRVARHGAGPRDVQFFLAAPGSRPGPATTEAKGKKGKKGPPKAGPPQAGHYISVEQFFKEEYDQTVDPAMPVVNVGTRENPVYLPVEVCEVEPGQPAKTKLTGSQTSNMLRFAVIGRKPAQNAQSIVAKGVGMLGLGEPMNATLSAFGIHPSTDLITVPGRVLPAPRIFYKDAKSVQKGVDTMGGSWNMRQIRFSRPATMKSWTWLYVDALQARSFWPSPWALDESLGKFTKTLRDMGIAVDPPKPGRRIELTGDNDAAVVETAIRDLQEEHQPSLVLTILHTKDTALYNCIKQVCDVRCGVRNVNVLAERLKDANDQYCANVGLKINLKLGGVNQSLQSSDLGFIAEGRTMLVGIDVTHPSPGSTSSAPSVAGIVASVDAQLAQWPAEIRIQAARQEMVADLDALLRTRLQHWAKHNNNTFPENIVVYRDGVSEGQYDTVIDRELPLLKSACAAVYPAAETKRNLPRLAVVVVGKRHNTRFYPTQDADADRSANPLPGTVVDRAVTEARHWDFYLQAHAALQGTARPAHYFTVWDEIFRPNHPAHAGAPGAADVLQDLTHKMCYLFGRATKAVSVCPPAYYADLVCTRARCYLSDVFDPTPSATPSASAVGSAEGRGAVPQSHDVEIHPAVRDAMFYI